MNERPALTLKAHRPTRSRVTVRRKMASMRVGIQRRRFRISSLRFGPGGRQRGYGSVADG